MKTKVSQFNNRIVISDIIYYYNSLTNAIIELKNSDYEVKMLDEISSLITQDIEKNNKFIQLGMLVNKELMEDHIIDYSYQKNKFNNNFLTLELFPSYYCNLKCDFCTLKKLWVDKKLLNMPEIENYFNNISTFINNQPMEKVKIILFGGEPLILHKQIDNFLNNISNSKKIFASLITNGTLLSKDIINKLACNKRITNFQFSFDGTPMLHNKTKGSKTAFSDTINGINNLITSNYNRNIAIRINISEINKNSIPDLMKLLSEKIIKYDKLIYYSAFIHNTNNIVDDNYCVESKNSHTFSAQFNNVCKKLDLRFDLSLSPLLNNCTFSRVNAYVVAPDLKLYMTLSP